MKEIELKAQELLGHCEVITLAAIDEQGFPRPVPLSGIKNEGIKKYWFATGTSSDKTRFFQKNPKAGLCFYEGSNSVVLTGMIKIVEDEEVKKMLWQDWFIEHFPEGIHDPEYCILEFLAEKGTFWIDGVFVKDRLS